GYSDKVVLLQLPMSEPKVTGKTNDAQLLRRMQRYVRPYRGIFAVSVVLTIMIAGVAPALPIPVEYTLDRFILQNDIGGLRLMLLLMLGLLLLQTVVRYFHTLMTNTLGQSVIRDLRINVFNHITGLRLKYFDRTPIGRLITRTI